MKAASIPPVDPLHILPCVLGWVVMMLAARTRQLMQPRHLLPIDPEPFLSSWWLPLRKKSLDTLHDIVMAAPPASLVIQSPRRNGPYICRRNHRLPAGTVGAAAGIALRRVVCALIQRLHLQYAAKHWLIKHHLHHQGTSVVRNCCCHQTDVAATSQCAYRLEAGRSLPAAAPCLSVLASSGACGTW